MRTLTHADVIAVANALIILNGSTTTLEIKNVLRKKGFWATQDVVRYSMLDATSKGSDLRYRDTGIGHRTYYLVSDSASFHDYSDVDICRVCGCSREAVLFFGWTCKAAADPQTTPTPQAVVDLTPVTTSTNPAVVHSDYIPATYIVRDAWGNFTMKFENVTRSEAKHLWSKSLNTSYTNARTVKIP